MPELINIKLTPSYIQSATSSEYFLDITNFPQPSPRPTPSQTNFQGGSTSLAFQIYAIRRRLEPQLSLHVFNQQTQEAKKRRLRVEKDGRTLCCRLIKSLIIKHLVGDKCREKIFHSEVLTRYEFMKIQLSCNEKEAEEELERNSSNNS